MDRGFVDKEHAEAALSGTEEPVEVTGLLRLQPKKNSFTPDNRPDKGEWFWADVPQLVEHAGGEEQGVQPVLVEALFRTSNASYRPIFHTHMIALWSRGRCWGTFKRPKQRCPIRQGFER